MLNGTMCAVTRVICALLENYQTEKGVVVPDALLPLMPAEYSKQPLIPFVKPAPIEVAKKNEQQEKEKEPPAKGVGKEVIVKKQTTKK
jgi:seryl-tRNA synthetase